MAASDLNIGAAGSVAPIPTSRALTRVTPVVPQPATEPRESPLQGSGIDLRGLLQAPDQVVVRARTPAVALDAGLEQARGAMVRNQPADALATLDEVWSGARHTETGWYLRGGSLALLGLTEEAARVVVDGLRSNPSSAANHFLHSLARLAMGDPDTAAGALSSASRQSEPSALLDVQRALLLAHQGKLAEAEELMRRAAARWPEHPALVYGKAVLRETVQQLARDRRSSRTAGADLMAEGERAGPMDGAHEAAHEAAHEGAHDMVHDGLRQLGRLLLHGSRGQTMDEARSLVGSLSAGGTLAAALPAARAHALRALLGAMIEALRSDVAEPSLGIDAESVGGHWQRATPAGSRTPVNAASVTHDPDGDSSSVPHREDRALFNTVRLVTIALRDGRVAEADAQLHRASGSMSRNTELLLRTLIGAAREASGESAPPLDSRDGMRSGVRSATPGASDVVHQIFRAPDVPALLAPLRLGLALLPENELGASTSRLAWAAEESARHAANSAYDRVHGFERFERSGGNSVGILAVAITLLALAVLAFASELKIVSIGLAAAGIWLALRRARAPDNRPPRR